MSNRPSVLPPSPAQLVRFMCRVSVPLGRDECWKWKGPRIKGYGQFWISQSSRLAHRASWLLMVGDIPTGQCVLHRCDTPACVNPRHLFLGTQLENIADCISKGRNVRGETQGRSKVTSSQVLKIRELRRSGVKTEAIAKEFGVSHDCVRAIVRRTRWKHLN